MEVYITHHNHVTSKSNIFCTPLQMVSTSGASGRHSRISSILENYASEEFLFILEYFKNYYIFSVPARRK